MNKERTSESPMVALVANFQQALESPKATVPLARLSPDGAYNLCVTFKGKSGKMVFCNETRDALGRTIQEITGNFPSDSVTYFVSDYNEWKVAA